MPSMQTLSQAKLELGPTLQLEGSKAADFLIEGASQLDLDLSPLMAHKMLQYLAELSHWNKKTNLTAITDPQEMIIKHLLDSLAGHSRLQGDAILDVGTGAGLPGIPLALVNPKKCFVLLDSNGKKVRFLRHVIGLLKLEQVTAVHSRIEGYHPPEPFGTVVVRAFSALGKLVTSVDHCCAEDGIILAYKGQLDASELAQVPAAWKIIDTEPVKVPGLEAERHLIRLCRR